MVGLDVVAEHRNVLLTLVDWISGVEYL